MRRRWDFYPPIFIANLLDRFPILLQHQPLIAYKSGDAHAGRLQSNASSFPRPRSVGLAYAGVRERILRGFHSPGFSAQVNSLHESS
jgi:hypothetical protein